jgi:uncharacterized protein YcbX
MKFSNNESISYEISPMMRCQVTTADQGDGAASEASPRHAGAQHPRHSQRRLHQNVQLRTRHLVIIPGVRGGGVSFA